MGQANLFTFFLIGYPEEFLSLITCLLIVGRKDKLNIRNKINTIKIFSSALIMTIAAFFSKNVFGQGAVIVTAAAFVVVIILIFKVYWVEACAGILISLFSLIAFEYICITIWSQVVGLSFDGWASDSRARMYSIFSVRILQLILVVILYKIPIAIIDFGTIKGFTKKVSGKLALIFAYEMFCVFTIIKVARFDFSPTTLSGTLNMAVNITLIIAFIVLNILVTTRLVRNAAMERKNHAITLLWFKHLLAKHGNDVTKIDKMIDEVLNEVVTGGEYNEK